MPGIIVDHVMEKGHWEILINLLRIKTFCPVMTSM